MTTITISATITSNIIKGGGVPQIPPSNLTPPLISGSAVVGQTLSVSDGTWAASPTPTFSYQWKRNGSNIGGAIGNTYTLDQADATKVITCEVTATNIAGSASALSSNSLTILDADASAFITAASITNATQITAINVLTNDLKGYNIWSKMKAIYPFVGGTASTHKFNLKDPRDLDAAFRLVFYGGWIHSNTGATPNGTNAYADIYLYPFNTLSQYSTSASYYSRTNSDGTYLEISSSQQPAGNLFNLHIKYSGVAYYDQNNATTGRLSFSMASTNSTGLFQMSRTANNVQKAYINGSQAGSTNTQLMTSALPNNITQIARGAAGAYSNRQCAFATIGDGLTDTDVTNLSWITEQYQTTLGRSVNPWYNNGNLLLDNYPNAAVAYSVRKLRNYYIGAAIRVRRSSDNAEQDIYFDSTGNLDTASLLSFVGAGNGFVTTWYDQSGNNRNATQTVAAYQPKIVNVGSVITVNSKPSINWFNGPGNSIYLIGYKFAQPSTDWTLLSINRILNIIGNNNNCIGTDGSGYNSTGIYIQSGNLNANRSGGFISGLSPITPTSNVMFLSAFEYYNNNTVKIHTNNSISAIQNMLISGNPYTTGNLSNYWIGAYRDSGGTYQTGIALSGEISEHIVYPSNISSNINNIKSNINSYYTIY